MDFKLSPEVETIRRQVREFVAEHLLPLAHAGRPR